MRSRDRGPREAAGSHPRHTRLGNFFHGVLADRGDLAEEDPGVEHEGPMPAACHGCSRAPPPSRACPVDEETPDPW